MGMYALLTTTPAPNSLGGILQEAGDVVTNVLTWVGNVAETIVTTPLLLLPVGLFVMGAAVSFLSRLIRK